MLLIFEREVMYVHYKKTQIQRNANNDNGRKRNKDQPKGRNKKFEGLFHTKIQKRSFLEFIVMKI